MPSDHDVTVTFTRAQADLVQRAIGYGLDWPKEMNLSFGEIATLRRAEAGLTNAMRQSRARRQTGG